MPSNDQTLARLTRLWLKRLNLSDWRVKSSFVDPSTIAQNCAQCEWHPDTRQATIKLAYPSYLREQDTNIEETLVHELIHISLQGHRQYRGYSNAEERTINSLATALIVAYERKRKRKNVA